MARVSDNILPPTAQLGLTLDRYQELMGLSVCAFNGINRPDDNLDPACSSIVTQTQRDDLAMYLLQAEEMREEELGYYLGAKWRVEEQNVWRANPFTLDKKYLIEVGWPTWTAIQAGVALDWGLDPTNPNDPVEISVATTVSTSEIVVTYPGEQVQIRPSSITAVGGTVTIQIPRCRLVRPEYNQDWADPPSYFNAAVFLDEVDVYRLYADPSQGTEFKWIQPNCDTDCEPNCQTACAIILGHEAYTLSLVHLYPATYSGGSWTRATCFAYTGMPNSVQISYRSGRRQRMADEINTIRLAHTLMPRPPCSCDIVRQRWEDDYAPLERQWSPYGSRRGAIDVWMADSHAKIGWGGMV